MIGVRRLVRYWAVVMVMRSSEQLSALKNHFDDVNVSVHLSSYWGSAMKEEDIHLLLPLFSYLK
jgi:hypothetical protein